MTLITWFTQTLALKQPLNILIPLNLLLALTVFNVKSNKKHLQSSMNTDKCVHKNLFL